MGLTADINWVVTRGSDALNMHLTGLLSDNPAATPVVFTTEPNATQLLNALLEDTQSDPAKVVQQGHVRGWALLQSCSQQCLPCRCRRTQRLAACTCWPCYLQLLPLHFGHFAKQCRYLLSDAAALHTLRALQADLLIADIANHCTFILAGVPCVHIEPCACI